MMHKKAQSDIFQTLIGLAIAIAILGILLIVAFQIMSQGKTQAATLIISQSTNNESVTWMNNTFVALTSSPGAATLMCSAVANDTAWTTPIASGNWTCSPSGFKLTDEGADAFASVVYVNYTYKTGDEAFNSTSTLQNATDDIPTWVPLIVIAIIGSILIGVVQLFRRRAQR